MGNLTSKQPAPGYEEHHIHDEYNVTSILKKNIKDRKEAERKAREKRMNNFTSDSW